MYRFPVIPSDRRRGLDADDRGFAAKTIVSQQLRPVVQPPRHVAPAPQVRMRCTTTVQVRVLSPNVRAKSQPQQASDGRAQGHPERDQHVLRRVMR